ncbi:hypothetical protein CL614_06095 [archaeon]|nr:hypothetical protein [archaeon]
MNKMYWLFWGVVLIGLSMWVGLGLLIGFKWMIAATVGVTLLWVRLKGNQPEPTQLEKAEVHELLVQWGKQQASKNNGGVKLEKKSPWYMDLPIYAGLLAFVIFVFGAFPGELWAQIVFPSIYLLIGFVFFVFFVEMYASSRGNQHKFQLVVVAVFWLPAVIAYGILHIVSRYDDNVHVLIREA